MCLLCILNKTKSYTQCFPKSLCLPRLFFFGNFPVPAFITSRNATKSQEIFLAVSEFKLLPVSYVSIIIQTFRVCTFHN